MSEQLTPADRQVEDGAVDVFLLGEKSFRTFAYGTNIQTGNLNDHLAAENAHLREGIQLS